MTRIADPVDLDDIQGLLAYRRPAPYWGSHLLLRIDQAARGPALLRALLPHVTSAADCADGSAEANVTVALTYSGLKMLGVPEHSLGTFPAQMREGMAARAGRLDDTGNSAPAHWDQPFGTGDIHVTISATASSEAAWRARVAAITGQAARLEVSVLSRHDVAALPGARTTFGYRDGISFPNIKGLPLSPLTVPEPPLAAGEFLLGHPSENGAPLAMPGPDILGRNGSYLGIRKIATDVAAFRQFLRASAPDPQGQELLAARMLGRWRSGAPLMLAPAADDPALARDASRVNNFSYASDPQGLTCPHGAHIRRLNPRDAPLSTLADVRVHRILRFGTVYGDPLPDHALADDGAERGIYFIFLSARPHALEFLKTQWINDGSFISMGSEKDPIAGNNNPGDAFTIPARPVRRRLRGLRHFTTTKGGEYAFLPSLTALRWLGDPHRDSTLPLLHPSPTDRRWRNRQAALPARQAAARLPARRRRLPRSAPPARLLFTTRPLPCRFCIVRHAIEPLRAPRRSNAWPAVRSRKASENEYSLSSDRMVTMPALTDEQREARRSQILDGARACVAEYGLEAVSMEMIVERSGLSVGAVYRYFKGKDEIIAAAVTDGTRGWISALQPLLTQPDPPPLPELVKQLLQTIDTYRSGFEPDRRDVAVHGWSHAQTSPPLRAEVAALYRGLRDQYTSVCKTWQASSQLDPSAHPAAVAQLMMSITLGHTAQQALLGDSSGPEQAAALAALATPGDRTSGVRKR